MPSKDGKFVLILTFLHHECFVLSIVERLSFDFLLRLIKKFETGSKKLDAEKTNPTKCSMVQSVLAIRLLIQARNDPAAIFHRWLSGCR